MKEINSNMGTKFDLKPKGSALSRMKAGIVGAMMTAFTACLILVMALLPATAPLSTYAEATFNNIVNTNIGLHPQWSQSECDTVAEGGVGDSYTVRHTVWHAEVGDGTNGYAKNDVVMEKSPSYVFTGDEKNAQALSQRYSLKEGNDVVFNITDSDTAAKVWADAVAFAQSLGTPTPLADWSLAGQSPSQAHAGGGNENHYGFRVGTNTETRNMYQGNFFIENEEEVNGHHVLGQYITVRLHTDWKAKAVSVSVPNGTSKVDATTSDYVTLSGSNVTVTSTTFNYIKTSKQNDNDNYLSPNTDVFSRKQTSGNYTLSYDIASNSCNYDGNKAPVFNDNCAFSYGRINVPTGVYIVLDLNGHTIDRALTGIGRESGTTANGDLFGSVFHINSKARLEICDTSAYENASSLRISRYHKVAKDTPGAVALEGYGTDKIWQPISADNTTTTCDLVITNHRGAVTGGYNSGTTNRTGSYGAGVLIGDLKPEMQQRGGAVNLSMWADLVIHSGTIFGNKTPSETGGAFYQRSKAAVTVFDGYIVGNSANAGGVTSLGGGSGCPFTMYGGVLAYNSANGNGGAVVLARSSYGNFHGGEIVYNTAGGEGGALRLDGNTLGILDSVTITGNKAKTGGGVYVSPEVGAVDELWRKQNGVIDHAFKFRGSLQIYNNTDTTNNGASDVYLAHGTVDSSWQPGVIGEKLGSSWTGYPKIGIGGSMFVNGIVARVGVRLGQYDSSSANNIFTSGYAADHEGDSNNGVNTFVYFFSDNASYSVVNNSSGATMEATLGSHENESSALTWVVKGKGIYNGTEEDITIEAKDKTSNFYLSRDGGISYTYEGLTCEFGMLKVTSVAAYSSYNAGQPTQGRVAYWEITNPQGTGTYEITNSFTKAQFRFKLGEKDIEDTTSGQAHSLDFNSDMYKTINATDHSISYAGEYSFLVASGNTRYPNPNFKIRINQTGVVVGRQLYYNGKDVSGEPHNWTKDIDFDGDGQTKNDDARHIYEIDQPYFIYSGDYYYPVLSVDYNHTPNGMLSLHNPYTGEDSVVAKTSFTGYVLDFKYANDKYFGAKKDVDFGSHSGGGIEYQTMHRAPGSVSGIGTYVPGVMHAGMYTVSFISSRTAASADAANDDYKNTGVYFAANNFAFSSAVNIYVDPAGAEVKLTENAQNDFTYRGNKYDDREVVEFDNTSNTSVNPHTDANAIISYFLFNDLHYIPGIYDIRTGLYYKLSELAKWDTIRPTGTGYSGPGTKGPKLTNITDEELQAEPSVTWTDGGETFDKSAYTSRGDGDFDLAKFEKDYQRPRDMGSTGRLCYIIDNGSFADKKNSEPLNARRYVVLVSLKLDVGYEDYDYDFDQDAEHLVGLEDDSGYFWAFEFTIDPAEINPYETSSGVSATHPDSANTTVSITKELIYNNNPITTANLVERLGLTVSFGSTALTVDTDGVEGEGAGDYTVELASSKDYTNASVGVNPETYNLPVIIRFGGTNQNYVNAEQNYADKAHEKPLGDIVTTEEGLKGSAAHEYGPKDNAYAFVVYFRIIPVTVTVSGSLSYTYDGLDYDRARYLKPDVAPHDYKWFESIFFLVQDNITTPNELIENQHSSGFTTTDTFPAYEDDPNPQTRELDDLWGGTDADTPRYISRYTLSNPVVSYSSEEFKKNKIKLGIGLYSFNTGSPDVKSNAYHLTTVDYDNKGKTDDGQGGILTKPDEVGVTWLITYAPENAAAKDQTQNFNTSQNFVIDSSSFLDVTITQKNIEELAPDITKVGTQEFHHWAKEGTGTTLALEGGVVKTGVSYPFAGDSWQYKPGVTIEYQPYYMNSAKTAYGTALTLSATDPDDYDITWQNNTNASQDGAQIVLTGKGNYTGSLTLSFSIAPAKIAVTYTTVGAVSQYDKNPHPLGVEYKNAEETGAYSKYQEGEVPTDWILQHISTSSSSTPFTTAPAPQSTAFSTQYRKELRGETEGSFKTDEGAFTETAPTDAGRYEVKITLGSENYQFVAASTGVSLTPTKAAEGSYSREATGTHTILPALVTFTYANPNEVYNRQAHTPALKFTNVSASKGVSSMTNIIPLENGTEYSVQLKPVKPAGGEYAETATDAGNYTVQVTLKSENYCFKLTSSASVGESLIKGYNDGRTSSALEVSVESDYTVDKDHYNYTIKVDSGTLHLPKEGDPNTLQGPGDFVIKKATVSVRGFEDITYDRKAHDVTENIPFTNSVGNNEAVPSLAGVKNAGFEIAEGHSEYEVYYRDNKVIQNADRNSLDDKGHPYFAELYTVIIVLTEYGYKNFELTKATNALTPTLAHPDEAATYTDFRSQVLDDDSVIGKTFGTSEKAITEPSDDVTGWELSVPFLIDRVDINIMQLLMSDVYDRNDHFTGTNGTFVSNMFRYAASSAIEVDDLTLKVDLAQDSKTFATIYYYPEASEEKDKVVLANPIGDKKDYTFEEFKDLGMFTHIGDYEITVRFIDRSFYIISDKSTNSHTQMKFNYSITAARFTAELDRYSVPFDGRAHGVESVSSAEEPVKTDGFLRLILKGETLPEYYNDVGAAPNGKPYYTFNITYNGWSSQLTDETHSDNGHDYRDVGTYTVTLTFHDCSDFSISGAAAEGTYTLTYSITAYDLSGMVSGGEVQSSFGSVTFTDAENLSHYYTGSAQTPTPTVKLKKDVYTKGNPDYTLGATLGAADYKVSYSNNVNAGNAEVVFTGTNNYMGNFTVPFEIKPAVITVAATGTNDHQTQQEKAEHISTFEYNKSSHDLTLEFSVKEGKGGTTPTSADYKYINVALPNSSSLYALAVVAKLSNAAIDAGDYQACILLTSKNFVFYEADNIRSMFGDASTYTEKTLDDGATYCYSGKDASFADVVGFKFRVHKAQLNFFISSDFREIVDGKAQYVQQFEYDGTGWWTKVGSYGWANVLSDYPIVPVDSVIKFEIREYQCQLDDDGNLTENYQWKERFRGEVIDAGIYAVTFTITDADVLKNYQILNVYAGTAADGTDSTKAAQLQVGEVTKLVDGAKDNGKRELTGAHYKREENTGTTFSFSMAFEIIPATIDVHFSDLFVQGGAFFNKFVYDGTDWTQKLNSVTLNNTTAGNGAVPLADQYSVEFYQNTGDWGSSTPSVKSIVDVGNYAVTFRLSNGTTAAQGNKIWKNYSIHAVYAGSTNDIKLENGDAENQYRTGEGNNNVYATLIFHVVPAQVDVQFTERFKDFADGRFTFTYDASDWVDRLNDVALVLFGASGITPGSGEYTITFDETDKTATSLASIVNIGRYKLTFSIAKTGDDDFLNNFSIHAVCAGTSPMAEGQYSLDADMRTVTITFEVLPAEIDVLLASNFQEEGAFVNEFSYDRSDWAVTLKQLSFEGTTIPTAEEGTTIPTAEVDYEVTFQDGEGADVSEAVNAGEYVLVFTFKGEKLNFTIKTIKVNGTFIVAENDNAPRTEKGFNVPFTVLRAKINFFFSQDFRRKVEDGNALFVQQFEYDGTGWWTKIGSYGWINALTTSSVVPEDSVITFTIEEYKLTDEDANTYTWTPRELGFVIDAGIYRVTFTVTNSAVLKNFELAGVYAGLASEGTDAKYAAALTQGDITQKAKDVTLENGKREVTGAHYETSTTAEGGFTLSAAFEITPATIDVHFADLFVEAPAEGSKTFTNKFVYDGTDWTQRLNTVTLNNTTVGNNAVPTGEQYSIEFYHNAEGTSWGSSTLPVESVVNVGDYAVTFRLSRETTTQGNKIWRNYQINAVYAGSTNDIQLENGDGDGQYRTGTGNNNVYVTLLFYVTPAKVNVHFAELFKDFAEGRFTFTYDANDWVSRLNSVTMTLPDAKGITPQAGEYTVSFKRTSATAGDAASIYDIGSYTLTFAIEKEDDENFFKNFTIGDVYGGLGSALTKDTQYSLDTDANTITITFEVLPAPIDVSFPSLFTKYVPVDGDGRFEFIYDRNDWVVRLNSVAPVIAQPGVGTTPNLGSEYEILFYHYEGEKTDLSGMRTDGTNWNAPETITDTGVYMVVFSLSLKETAHGTGVRIADNYKVEHAIVNGEDLPHGQFRTATEAKYVTVTLMFEVMPAQVQLDSIAGAVYNGEEQDAQPMFSLVDGSSVLPAAEDYTLTYKVSATASNNENALLGGNHKPLNAGTYDVTVTLNPNFRFEGVEGDEEAALGEFVITPYTVTPRLATRGEAWETFEFVYDGTAHRPSILLEGVNATLGGEATTSLNYTAEYAGWAGTKQLSNADADYIDAGSYTVSAKLYRIADGVRTEEIGGNFWFGPDTYTATFMFSIAAKQITTDDVSGIKQGDKVTYDGQPQTKDIVVTVLLKEGEARKVLDPYNTDTQKGDYSISNSPDVNVGTVTANVVGMHNYQGAVNITYTILPAVVSATMNGATSTYYTAVEQGRAFTFTNTTAGHEKILPAYNATNLTYSDYTITYQQLVGGVWQNLENAPVKAGTYRAILTLKNSTGAGDVPNFKFAELASSTEGIERNSDTVMYFAFTIKKAEIRLAAIANSTYTGKENPAAIVFVNLHNEGVLPGKGYTVTYDDVADVPTDVKVAVNDRTPKAYRVKVTLSDEDAENFMFVEYEGDSAYGYDKKAGSWGEQDYTITPAIIAGRLNVTYNGETEQSVFENFYNAEEHKLDVTFLNVVDGGIGATLKHVKVTEKEDPKLNLKDMTAEWLYNITYDAEGLILSWDYSLTIVYTPSSGYHFEGMPMDAGTYAVTVKLKTTNFTFANDAAEMSWTYIVRGAAIQTSEEGLFGDGDFTLSYGYNPEVPAEFKVTASDFTFIDTADQYNFNHAVITYTSIMGGAYEAIVDKSGSTVGYKLSSAAKYTIEIKVTAPNHADWTNTITVQVEAGTVTITENGASITVTYGDEGELADAVRESFLKLVREGKLLVKGIPGQDAKKTELAGDDAAFRAWLADRLATWGIQVKIVYNTETDRSTSENLKVGNYKLDLSLSVGGIASYVKFEHADKILDETSDTAFFHVTPRAVKFDWSGLDNTVYNGSDRLDDLRGLVRFENEVEGDALTFYTFETGDFSGSAFEEHDAKNVGFYWAHINILQGDDAGNYVIATEEDGAENADRYRGEAGAYHYFEIKRREVNIILADSTSVYGDQAAIYGTEGAKMFGYSFSDDVLTREFGSNPALKAFILDLLALYQSDGILSKDTTPYPAVGTYHVKLDPNAGESEKWFVEVGTYHFDDNFTLLIDANEEAKHTITARPLTVQIDALSDYYGNDHNALTFTWTDVSNAVIEADLEDLKAAFKFHTEAKQEDQISDETHSYLIKYLETDDVYAETLKNYDISYVDGVLTILPRPIRVKVKSRSAVYGADRTEWPDLAADGAWIVDELDETNLGLYGGDDLGITLSYGLGYENVLTDAEGNVIPYTNAISGEWSNMNYAVTFVNEEGENSGGDFTILKRVVKIKILNGAATYGDTGIHLGSLLPAVEHENWEYVKEDGTHDILSRDLAYLTLYLGDTPDAFESNVKMLYAAAGTYPIVGAWAYGIVNLSANYDITFLDGEWSAEQDTHTEGLYKDQYGKAGVFTVSPATVTKEGTWVLNRPYKTGAEGVYTADAGWYRMEVLPSMFGFTADYQGARDGKVVFDRVEKDASENVTAIVYKIVISLPHTNEEKTIYITVAKPVFVPSGTEQEAPEGEPVAYKEADQSYYWYVHSVGGWSAAVTVSAESHKMPEKTEDFTLTYYIVSVHALVVLDITSELTITYSDVVKYMALTAGRDNYNDVYKLGDDQLQEYVLSDMLNKYIFGDPDNRVADIIAGVTGFEDAYGSLGQDYFISMLKTYCHIEVVDVHSNNLSKAGFLNAGVYDLQIVAEDGCGFTVSFVETSNASGTRGDIGMGGRNRLYIEPRVLEIDWVDEGELKKPENLKEDDTQITYTYSGYEFKQTPRFTNILASGDVSDAVDMPQFGTNFNFLNSAGEQVNYIRAVDSYTLKLLYNGDSVRLRGDDAGNYVLPEVIEKPFIVNPMKLSVTIHDQTSVYGAQPVELTWDPDGELGKGDNRGDLNIKLKCYTADGSSELEYDTVKGAVGSYKIVGTWGNDNYDITFVGSWEGEGEHQGHAGTYTVTKRGITVKIGDARSIYGNEDADLGFERNIEGLAYNDKDDDVGIKLSRKEGKNAGLYPIYGEADNTNYNVTFTGSWAGEEDAGRAGTYTVEQRDIHITLNDVTRTYGEWLDDDAHKAELDLEYTVDADYRLVDGDKLVFHHDKEKGINVGTYTLTASEEDDEDGNYNITVTNSGEAKLTITKRPIDIVIEDSGSVYGDPLKADADFKWHIDEGEGHLGLAAWDTNEILKVVLTLEGRSTVARANVGKYFAIKGAYTNGNYDVTFHDAEGVENNGVYSITKRPVKVTIRNAGSIYGAYLDNEFDASLQGGFDVTGMLAFAGTPDEHMPDDLRITLTKRSGRNVGEYEITGTSANKNYEIEWVNGTYTISKRPVTVIIHNQSCEYGQYGASDFLSLLLGTDKYHLKEGDKLAYNEGLADLAIILSKAAGIDAGDYDITGISLNGNYDVTFEKGVYTIEKAINRWEREFRLKEMNEGDTPAEEDIRPIAKFAAAGEPVVKYYLDEACTEEYTADLSEAQAGTYYVVVTVADCNNWSKLEKSYSFVVNPSFAVVNNNLELWPYIVLWSSQIVALTLALIFIRKKRKKQNSEIK